MNEKETVTSSLLPSIMNISFASPSVPISDTFLAAKCWNCFEVSSPPFTSVLSLSVEKPLMMMFESNRVDSISGA